MQRNLNQFGIPFTRQQNLRPYYENLVEFLVMLYLPDLNNVTPNQLNSKQQQQQFFRNMSNQNYHTNVVNVMKQAILNSNPLYNEFRNFALVAIYRNSRMLNINLNKKDQYNSIEKRTIYSNFIYEIKRELQKRDIDSPFFIKIKELMDNCNLIFSQRKYPNYMLPVLCENLVKGKLQVPLPYSEYMKLKLKQQQIRNQI